LTYPERVSAVGAERLVLRGDPTSNAGGVKVRARRSDHQGMADARGRGTRPEDGSRRGWYRSLPWAILALGVVLTSVLGVVWYQLLRDREAQDFRQTASGIEEIVAGGIARQSDTLSSMRGVVSADPDLTNAQFLDWYQGADVAGRLPGSLGVSYVQRVPAAELPAFAARQAVDPATDLPTPVPFVVYPERTADEYCLMRLGVWSVGEVNGFVVPAGFDYCTPEIPGAGPSPVVGLLDEATRTGNPVVVPPEMFIQGVTALFAPVYAGGVTPDDEAGRRAASTGWVGTSFASSVLVEGAMAGHSDVAVSVAHRYRDTWSEVAAVGTPDSGDRRSTLPVSADWQVTVAEHVTSSGLPAGVGAGLVVAAGLAITVLLALVVRLLASSRDRALSMVEEKTAELEYQALHDPLTGLPNRALLLDRLALMLARTERGGPGVAALFIDVDDFKSINDSLGHAAGDAYLRGVAGRIESAIREVDSVGRLGGDEFVVLVEVADPLAGPEMVAERIMDVLAEPITINGLATPVSCSIGVAAGPRKDAEALVHDADLAMYHAKASGKRRVVVFAPELEREHLERIALEWDLRGALERDELRLRYQPSFDLRTGTTTGAEALLRWDHPERGLVEPAEFLPIAEETGLIVPIGRWVLFEACRQAVEWHRDGYPIRIAVNVSARQLDHDDLVGDVRAALASTGLPAESLVLEVTETTLMNDAAATQVRLARLEGLGVHIAIDDFGTGYSSMAYLQQFSVDAIKIDRSFIAGIANSPESHTIIRTLIQLGDALGLETLAEGIEDRGQLDALVRDDCDSGQGFLYARPLAADDMGRFLHQHARPASTSVDG
jgi:diguanylate cyclase (GGDEF)-like protein